MFVRGFPVFTAGIGKAGHKPSAGVPCKIARRYVSGIYDLQFAPKVPTGVCPPANLDAELLGEVVTAYLDTHEDGPAAEAIGQSVVRFFPCGPGVPKKP